jgi:hypothetical protein
MKLVKALHKGQPKPRAGATRSGLIAALEPARLPFAVGQQVDVIGFDSFLVTIVEKFAHPFD